MNGRLIYVVGPSGSGKDSVIDYARARIPADAGVAFARRTVTRPADAGGEEHIAVTPAEFDALRASGAFAMHWQANDHCYGIGREVSDWLAAGRIVVVSGSRAHLAQARAAFPQIEIVQVSAPPDVLRERLLSRGREDPARVHARVARGAELALPEASTALHIANDDVLAHAGQKLIAFLLRR
jgi:ribose 1,5-bisphosphokinase